MPTYPLGRGIKLPDYIKSKRAIISLEKAYSGKELYKDNLCIFRCLAYHKNPTLYIKHNSVFEETVEGYKRKYLAQSGVEKGFEGIKLQDIVAFENCFKINIILS